MGGFHLCLLFYRDFIAFYDRIPSAFDRIVQLLAARGISSATRGWTKRVDALSKTILREKKKLNCAGIFDTIVAQYQSLFNYYWWSRSKISLQLVLTYNCEVEKFSTREAIWYWKIRSVFFYYYCGVVRFQFYWKN